jgi:hypothetical protein
VDTLFIIAVIVALTGLVIAGRFLWAAWSDFRFRRQMRQEQDRRQRDLPIPMERRRRDRRQ